MSLFTDRLRACQPDTQPEQWVYVPYDQLSDAIGPLAQTDPGQVGIVLIESRWKAGQRKVHRQKLLHVLANQRHFALEQAERGVRIDYRFSEQDYETVLREAAEEHGRLIVQRPAELELRANLTPLFDAGIVHEVPHGGWLTTRQDFEESCPEPPFRMDRFYKHVRKRLGVLVTDNDEPAGGKWSHDADNRMTWKGDPALPQLPSFEPDDITREVVELIEQHFGDHPGRLDPTLPTTRDHAQQLWTWGKKQCMENFGPFEDAMTHRSRTLFHTRISALLNSHRLLPRAVVDDVLALDIPINSKEGFVRQVLGWREFVRHVHDVSDGFRRDGMTADALELPTPLPAAWWGSESGLRCLDDVVEGVWAEAYSHHIPRLMVLSNIALLLDVSARELTDWFWVAYSDAYDWVVEPNVLGMGTFATGELMTTKPYIAGSAYIHRMSDYCQGCRFHPKKTCPLTPMYWAFLSRHEGELTHVHRLGRQLGSARNRSDDKKAHDERVFEWVRDTLARGASLDPDDHPG